MILGRVADQEARIKLTVRSLAGYEEEIDAVIDTGFTDCLTIPTWMAGLLGLPFAGSTQTFLADGSFVEVDVYLILVDWDGRTIEVSVLAMDSIPLVGMTLLEGCRLTIEAIEGGLVTIEPIA